MRHGRRGGHGSEATEATEEPRGDREGPDLKDSDVWGWTHRKRSKWWQGNDFGFEHSARSAFKRHQLAGGNWTCRLEFRVKVGLQQ